MGEILNLKSIENHGTVRNYSAFSSTISYKFLFLNFLIIAKLNRIKKKPILLVNHYNYNDSTRSCTNINYRANSTKYNEYLEWAKNNP